VAARGGVGHTPVGHGLPARPPPPWRPRRPEAPRTPGSPGPPSAAVGPHL